MNDNNIFKEKTPLVLIVDDVAKNLQECSVRLKPPSAVAPPLGMEYVPLSSKDNFSH